MIVEFISFEPSGTNPYKCYPVAMVWVEIGVYLKMNPVNPDQAGLTNTAHVLQILWEGCYFNKGFQAAPAHQNIPVDDVLSCH